MRKVQVLAVALVLILGTSVGGLAATVKIVVNGITITDIQISARAALMRIEKRGRSNSDRLKLATQELIDEAVETSEADRLGFSVTDAQVHEAYVNVGRNVKLSEDKLTKFLIGTGVNPQTLKNRLKANILWGNVVRMEVAPQVNVSDLTLDKEAKAKLQDNYLNYDYILKEVRFIVPTGSKVSVSSRTAQANQYRKSFQGCKSAVDLSLSYTDVAVLDVGRRNATQLPDAMAKELAGLNVGQITKPRVAQGGVSMLAVCAKESAQDTTFIKEELRKKTGNEIYKKDVADFLDKLRKQATIIYK